MIIVTENKSLINQIKVIFATEWRIYRKFWKDLFINQLLGFDTCVNKYNKYFISNLILIRANISFTNVNNNNYSPD